MTDIIDNFFDKVYVINLSRSEGRLNKFRSNYEQTGLPWKVERFEAIDGSKIKYPNWFNRSNGHGALGCYFSHLNIIQQAKENGLKNVLIMEDDVQWRDDSINILRNAMEQLPNDWQFFYLGGEYYHRKRFRKNQLIRFPVRISENIVRADNVNRTHAYAINGNAYDLVINHLLRGNHQGVPSHIDHQYGLLHEQPNTKCYIIYPSVCYQGENQSTITGQHLGLYKWEIKMSYDSEKKYRVSDFLVGYGNIGLNGSLGYEDKKVTISGVNDEYETLSVHAPSDGVIEFDNDVELFAAQNGDMDSLVTIDAKVDGKNIGAIRLANSKTSSIVLEKGQHHFIFNPKGGKGGAHSVWCWKDMLSSIEKTVDVDNSSLMQEID